MSRSNFYLLGKLIEREFKRRYQRSALGILWSMLNPLIIMGIQYVVFSTLFASSIERYPIYLLSGLILYNFFNEAISVSSVSIVDNRNLITKAKIPMFFFPVSRVLASSINFLFAFLMLCLVSGIIGVRPYPIYLLLIVPLLTLTVFSIGLGLILATSMVFFRDTVFIWGFVSMIWMYITPLFYPISILPNQMQRLLEWNPLYIYVTAFRAIFIYGTMPAMNIILKCFLFAIISIVIGMSIFSSVSKRFIFYL